MCKRLRVHLLCPGNPLVMGKDEPRVSPCSLPSDWCCPSDQDKGVISFRFELENLLSICPYPDANRTNSTRRFTSIKGENRAPSLLLRCVFREIDVVTRHRLQYGGSQSLHAIENLGQRSPASREHRSLYNRRVCGSTSMRFGHKKLNTILLQRCGCANDLIFVVWSCHQLPLLFLYNGKAFGSKMF